MSDRPSAPLLQVLRDLVKKKGLTSASVADSTGIDRKRARRVLAGKDPMTVDELLLFGNALDLSPEDLAFPLPEAPAEPMPTIGLASASAAEVPEAEDDRIDLDMWGNHPEQLFRTAFKLSIDFLVLLDTAYLVDSGIPKTVLRQYNGKDLPLKFDAAYHPYNAPRYGDDAVTVSLSFDSVYDCTFPWAAFKQFVFYPAAPEPDEEPEEPERPTLRLVT